MNNFQSVMILHITDQAQAEAIIETRHKYLNMILK